MIDPDCQQKKTQTHREIKNYYTWTFIISKFYFVELNQLENEEKKKKLSFSFQNKKLAYNNTKEERERDMFHILTHTQITWKEEANQI